MSDDRGLYADIVSNGAGGIMASIEGQTYGPGVPSLDPGLQAGDSVPVGFMHPGSSRQPLLLARRPILKEIPQGVLDHFIGAGISVGQWLQYAGSSLLDRYAGLSWPNYGLTAGSFAAVPNVVAGAVTRYLLPPYGLVSFLRGGVNYIAIAHGRYLNATDPGLYDYVVKWFTLDGSLAQSWSISTAHTAPYGQGSQGILHVNPENAHLFFFPGVALGDFDAREISVWMKDSPVFNQTPVAQDVLSFQNVSGQYSLSAYSHINYLGPTILYASSPSLAGSARPLSIDSRSGGFRGYVRDPDTEAISSAFILDPATLLTIPRSIVANTEGVDSGGFPSDGTQWVVAVSGKSLLDPGNAQDAALGFGYRQSAALSLYYSANGGVPFQMDMSTLYSRQLQVAIAGIAMNSGLILWKWTKEYPSTVWAEVNELCSPFENYFVARGPNKVFVDSFPESIGPTEDPPNSNHWFTRYRNWSGQVSSKQFTFPSDPVQDAYDFTTNLFPCGYETSVGSGTASHSTDFLAPEFEAFISSGIRLFPIGSANNADLDAPSSASAYCDTGNRNNWLKFAGWLKETGTNGSNSTAAMMDRAGNSYFSFAVPYGIRAGFNNSWGNTMWHTVTSVAVDGDPTAPHPYRLVTQTQLFYYVPGQHFLYQMWEVSLDSRGALRWIQDRTQPVAGASFSEASPDSQNHRVGATVAQELPLVDEWWGKARAVGKQIKWCLRDWHILGPNYKPTTFLQAVRTADGFESAFQDLRISTAALSANVLNGDGSIKYYAGESLWDVKGFACRLWAFDYSQAKDYVYTLPEGYCLIYAPQSTRDGSQPDQQVWYYAELGGGRNVSYFTLTRIDDGIRVLPSSIQEADSLIWNGADGYYVRIDSTGNQQIVRMPGIA